MDKKISEIITENISWKDITPAGNVYAGGTSEEFNTGEWRVDKPIFINVSNVCYVFLYVQIVLFL